MTSPATCPAHGLGHARYLRQTLPLLVSILAKEPAQFESCFPFLYLGIGLDRVAL